MTAFRDLPEFDRRRLSTDATRRHFENVLARIDEVGRSMIAGYRPRSAEVAIVGCYKDTPYFNAASWKSRKTLSVGLGAAVIPLLTSLFAALLSDREVLPALPFRSSEPSMPGGLMLDLTRPDVLTDVRLTLSAERVSATNVLADLCVTFIYLHELGHILCGHVEAARRFWRQRALVEFARARGPVLERLPLRQYWEYQADSVAARLMAQYVDILVESASDHPWLRLLTKGRGGKRALRRHVGALTNMAIATMFIFMEGCRLERRAPQVHPHPVVRSLYVKDRLVRSLADRWGYSPEECATFNYRYLEPFLFGLARLGLGSVQDWDPEILEEMEAEGRRVAHGRELRDIARPWSWVPVEEWAA